MKPSWLERAKKHNGLPNLGTGGTTVTIFVGSFFAAKLAGVFLIILTRGWRAYFEDGLRVIDWKHEKLSNGETVPALGLVTLAMMFFLIACAEWIAGFVPDALARCGSWGIPLARLIGGIALLVLSYWLYNFGGTFSLLHPVPFSALIAGSVMVYSAVNSIFSK